MSDAAAFVATVIVFGAIVAAGGSPLGALGAVLRLWLFAAAFSVLIGRTWRPRNARVGLAAAFIAAIACEVAVEMFFPSMLAVPLEDSGTCYDRQGAHPC